MTPGSAVTTRLSRRYGLRSALVFVGSGKIAPATPIGLPSPSMEVSSMP